MRTETNGRRRIDGHGARLGGDLVLRVLGDGRLSAAVVAGVLVAVALIVQVAGGGASPVGATVDEVRTAVLACPTTPAAGAGADRLTVVAGEGRSRPDTAGEGRSRPDTAGEGRSRPDTAAPGQEVRGALRVDESSGAAKPKLRRTKPGVAQVELSGTTAPAAVVRATGGLAPGLAAERIVAIGEGPARALSSTSCLAAGASAWFVGASTEAGRQSRLVLTNTAGTSASVALRLWDEGGRVEVAGVNELVVEPRSTRVISLEGLAPDRRRLGVGVEVDRGQVSTALHLAEVGGRGADWLDPLIRPTRRLVVPGISAEAQDRKLFLLAPGDRDAIVKVRVLGVDSDFAPAGADVVELPAGTVREVDLNAADPGRALSVVISSDTAVVAAVRTIATVGAGPEQAWAGSAAALTGPTAVPDGRAGAGVRTRLLLAAPDGDAAVRVVVYVGSDAPRGRTVKIAAGRTLVLDPGPRGATSYTVVLEPMADSGPVHAARVLRIDAAGLTVSSLDTGRFSVELPAVVPDLTAPTVERPDRN